ncbi:MAG: N-acetyltransferase [Anaerolineae bacterium]|nr:N-acetyltransferase [Anaerolineae bacterium]
MIIRTEQSLDYSAIEQITAAAFADKPYSNQTEHLMVKRLREAGALTLSLVAELDGKIVGHVAFSAVTINGEYLDWYGLGPVSVIPKLQKQGIGSKIIRMGLSLLKEKGAKGCVLEGSPIYYQRFGFKAYPHLIYEGAPAPEYFMAMPFYESVPSGKVEFHQAFYGDV